MIQGGDYLLKENEDLGGENDHKMIILLTFYTVKVGSRVYVVCFKSTGYYIKGGPDSYSYLDLEQIRINALLRARVVSYDIPRSPVKQRCIKRRSLSWIKSLFALPVRLPYSSSIAVLDLKMARHTNPKMRPVSGC
ncbi:hypothetical protein OkiPb00531_18190 [Escherichia coli]|jgi:hypothetical protein